MDKPRARVMERTDSKDGVVPQGLPVPWGGRERGVGQWEPMQAKKAHGKVQGIGVQGVPSRLASGAWILDNPWKAMSHPGHWTFKRDTD